MDLYCLEFDAFFDYSNWMFGCGWDAKLKVFVACLGPLVFLAYQEE
jgi:hypothetical protein